MRTLHPPLPNLTSAEYDAIIGALDANPDTVKAAASTRTSASYRASAQSLASYHPFFEWDEAAICAALMIRAGDAYAPPLADAPHQALHFQTLAELAEQVRNAPIPTWLIRSLWPADAYGILGAEDKAGKTWAMLDLAIAVAAGLRWLDHWPIDEAGPVLVFVGEGSERKMLRRLYAIGHHYGLDEADVDALPIRLCMRVPTLTNAEHLASVMHELIANPARLVILDPLYLAAGDTETSQLNKMGVVLGTIQHVAQAAGAALVVAHHWNKSGDGTDRKRFTGAGTAEWGRVLVSMSVIRRTTENPDTTATSVVDLKLEIIGDEVADVEATFRRRVWTDDPTSLASRMHYVIERTQLDPSEMPGKGSTWDAAKAAADDLRAYFTIRPETEAATRGLYDGLRKAGHRHADRAVRDAANDLVAEGFLTVKPGPRGAQIWSRATPPEATP